MLHLGTPETGQRHGDSSRGRLPQKAEPEEVVPERNNLDLRPGITYNLDDVILIIYVIM